MFENANTRRTNDLDIYNAYSREIAREDQLLGERTGWLITAQGLLFAALGLIKKVQTPNAN